MSGEIGARMFRIMDEKGIKSRDICAILNLKESTISSWKARGKDPDAKDIFAICEVLGVSCEYLLTGISRPAVPVQASAEDASWLDLLHSLPREVKEKCKSELEGYLKYAGVTAPMKQAK